MTDQNQRALLPATGLSEKPALPKKPSKPRQVHDCAENARRSAQYEQDLAEYERLLEEHRVLMAERKRKTDAAARPADDGARATLRKKAHSNPSLLAEQQAWAAAVARFADLCMGPADAIPQDEIHLIVCRDAAAVLELHVFILAHVPDGSREWNDQVRDCAFKAWRRIEPTSLTGNVPQSWGEMQAAGFRLLAALPSTPTSLKLPAHAHDCPCLQSYLGDEYNGSGCMRCPFYDVASQLKNSGWNRHQWMVSLHNQDWEQRHTALARGERLLLWTDKEVCGEVPETRQFAEGARGRGFISLNERGPVNTWNPARYQPYHRRTSVQGAAPSIRSPLALSLLAVGCPTLADLADTDKTEYEFLWYWAEDQGKLASDGISIQGGDAVIREWRLSADYRNFLVGQEYGYDDRTRDTSYVPSNSA